MRNRHDEYVLIFNRVENPVRKDPRQAATNIFIHPTPTHRVLQNCFDSLLNRDNKPQVQPWFFARIVKGSLVVLLQRSG